MSLCFMLTAGLGTRLKPFTEVLPKPCLPFLNLPLMNYGFYLAQQAGFKNFLFNKHHLPNKLEAQVSQLKVFCETSNISDETSEILGSGGAIHHAKPFLKDLDYFIIANGDEVLIPQNTRILKKLVEKFQLDQSLCTLLTCDHPELLKTLKPVWLNKDQHVVGFGMEKPAQASTPAHYTGYKVFSKRIFNFLPSGESNIFYDVLKKAIASGEKISTLHIDRCHWYETGNFDGFLEASQSLLTQHRDYLEQVLSFYSKEVQVHQKNGTDVLVAPKAWKMNPQLTYKGFNVLGENISLKGAAQITNSIICDQASLAEGYQASREFVF